MEVVHEGTPISNPQGFGWDILVNWSTYKEYIEEIYPKKIL
jgi:hypothetical protein